MKPNPRVRRKIHCLVCDQNFTAKDKFFEHASSTHCSSETGGGRDTEDVVRCFLVRLDSTKDYTMYVEMPSHATLFELDALLREKWVECCWHSSRFMLKSSAQQSRRHFPVHEQFLAMDTCIDQLPLGSRLEYEYDFGTPTIVYATPVLRYQRARQPTDRTLNNNAQQQQRTPGVFDCTDTIERDFERYTAGGNNVGEVPQDVKVIGRNVPPTYWCEQCDSREAKYLDQECDYMTLCVQCAASDRHSDHDGMIVLGNSPRDGLCGYGEAVDMDDVFDDAEKAMV